MMTSNFTSNISIKLIDLHSPSKDKVISGLLELQRSLIIPIQKPLPEENKKNGYLLMQMSPSYVYTLLEQHQGVIVGAFEGDALVGYTLLTDSSPFKKLYKHRELGFIDTTKDPKAFEAFLSQPNVGYIDQIGVKPDCSKKGIGKQLVETSKQLKPQGLVADVFLKPLKNEASLNFFV